MKIDFYCQRHEECESKCDVQCDHCKEYYGVIVKDKVLANVKKSIIYPKSTGGQSCGIPATKVKLYSDELGIAIEIDCFRSQLKSVKFAMKLMSQVYDELTK